MTTMDSRCLLLLGLLPFSPAIMADDDAPDLALLEFLGAWEDSDGEWINPLQILDELEADNAKENAETAPAAAKEQNDD